MTISVNGQPHEVAPETTVGELITTLGIRRAGIAVACNDDVVPGRALDATALRDGDTVEIIVAAAGG